MSKNHCNGHKIGGRHTTIIDAAQKVVDYLKKNNDVSSVTVGNIKMGLKNSSHSMKIKVESGCLLLKVRGTKSIQDIRVFSRNLEAVQTALMKEFPK